MNVLAITGDKNFKPGHPRFDLQRSAVERLESVFWGRGRMWPRVPAGRFDVVTAQDPFWRGVVAWMLARRLGAKLNIQAHADLYAQSWPKRFLARMVLRRADSVRAVSKKVADQACSFGARGPVRVLPVFVDLARFKAITPQPHERKTMLWLGRFEPEKDPLEAIAVLRAVRGAGVDAALVMLGAGSLAAKLREEATGLPVEFPGWRDPLPYLARVDVVLGTSRSESWGSSMVEALAAGIPVVAPDVGIARDAGALVVPRARLADGVVEVLRADARGRLLIDLPHADEWARQWQESLV